MSDRSGLARALRLRRNAAVGFGLGVLVAGLAYAYRMLALGGPAPARGSPALFLLLAFVLAVSLGLLVTGVLTFRRALRLARED